MAPKLNKHSYLKFSTQYIAMTFKILIHQDPSDKA